MEGNLHTASATVFRMDGTWGELRVPGRWVIFFRAPGKTERHGSGAPVTLNGFHNNDRQIGEFSWPVCSNKICHSVRIGSSRAGCVLCGSWQCHAHPRLTGCYLVGPADKGHCWRCAEAAVFFWPFSSVSSLAGLVFPLLRSVSDEGVCKHLTCVLTRVKILRPLLAKIVTKCPYLDAGPCANKIQVVCM